MKLNSKLGSALVAASLIGAGAAWAATTTAPTGTAPVAAPAGKHWHPHHGGMLVGAMLHAAHQLNLTTDQQAAIKNILSAARTQHQQSEGSGPDLSALANPGDPNYATALQAAKARAETRWQKEVELQGQIYNVLTADQKARLPQVLADMKTKAEQRRAAWQQQHGSAAPGAAGSN